MTSPLAWVFSKWETVAWQDSLLQCWKMAFTQSGGADIFLLIYLLWNGWFPMAVPLWFHLMFAHVWCYLVRPPYLLTHSLQPALDHTRPPSAGGCAVWQVRLRWSAQMAETQPLWHFLKCQVTITWFGFRTLFTKVSRWPFEWRCLPVTSLQMTPFLLTVLCSR